MLFDQDWDLRLLAQAHICSKQNSNYVISSYPNSFVIENGIPTPKPITNQVLGHVVAGDSNFKEGLTIKFSGVIVKANNPIKGFHLGAGCLFAPGHFVSYFPYDPQLYFAGEEQALSARLYTHGWDIFHVPNLPIYHLYEDVNPTSRPKHWDKEQNKERIHPSSQMYWHSEARLKDILLGRADLGVFGLGSVRTMQDYEKFSGIDYVNKLISKRARVGPWSLVKKFHSQSTLDTFMGLSQNGKSPEQIVIMSPLSLPLDESNILYSLVKELNQLNGFARLFLLDLNSDLSIKDDIVRLASPQPLHANRLVTDHFKSHPNTLLIFPEIFTALITKFPNNGKAVWWLSVDNAFSWNPGLSDAKTLDDLLHKSGLTHLYLDRYIQLFLEEKKVMNALLLSNI
jgi:hypothetical protein